MYDWFEKVVIREQKDGTCGVSYVFSQSGEQPQCNAADFEKALKHALSETDCGMSLRFEKHDGTGYELKVSHIEKL